MVNETVLRSLIPVGGIRIEDDVLITRDGCRVLNDVSRAGFGNRTCAGNTHEGYGRYLAAWRTSKHLCRGRSSGSPARERAKWLNS